MFAYHDYDDADAPPAPMRLPRHIETPQMQSPIVSFLNSARPASIAVPNFPLDQMLGLTEAELKVLLFIVRQTLGYSRDSVTLTYAQIAYGCYGSDGQVLDRGTGLCPKTIGRAVRLLREKSYITTQNAGITRRAASRERTTPTGTAAIYRLGLRMRCVNSQFFRTGVQNIRAEKFYLR